MPTPFIEDVAPDIARLICPMPGIGSVNCWLVGGPHRQMIVDTGIPGQDAAALWQKAEDAGIVGNVEAIVCTHMHRDHSGQVPALVARHGAPLSMTVDEHERVVAASSASHEARRDNLRRFLIQHGVTTAEASRIEPPDYSVLAPFPRNDRPLVDGMVISAGGRTWRVLTGGGHSSNAACLIAEDESLMLAGDQVLGGAGPHITVGLDEPEADLLSRYFDFLNRLSGLSETMLILPGHGSAFRGVAHHARALRRSHQKRLDRLVARMDGAMSCAEIAPLVFAPRTMQHFGYLVPGMTLSLANHLWQGGALRRHLGDDGVVRFEKA